MNKEPIDFLKEFDDPKHLLSRMEIINIYRILQKSLMTFSCTARVMKFYKMDKVIPTDNDETLYMCIVDLNFMDDSHTFLHQAAQDGRFQKIIDNFISFLRPTDLKGISLTGVALYNRIGIFIHIEKSI